MNVNDLTSAQLRKAAALKEQIERLQQQLADLLDNATSLPAAPQGGAKKKTLSAAARKKVSEFQKARWAAIKAAAQPTAKPKRKKFTMSAAAKAAISRAAKARWAKIKAAQKK